MILVIASELDTLARDIVTNWPRKHAILLTPRDLCTRGWRIELGLTEGVSVVASGTIVRLSEVSGVLSLLPYVFDYELFSIEESARKYVSAELRALLFYLLTRLRCPIINRPTAQNLSGPDWRHEQWALECQKVCIPTKRTYRKSRSLPPHGNDSTLQSISVIGNTSVANNDLPYRPNVVALAQCAGVTFLQVRFIEDAGSHCFHSVQLIPDLTDCNLVTAVQNYFANA